MVPSIRVQSQYDLLYVFTQIKVLKQPEFKSFCFQYVCEDFVKVTGKNYCSFLGTWIQDIES